MRVQLQQNIKSSVLTKQIQNCVVCVCFFIMSHILGTFVAHCKIFNMVYLNFSNNGMNSLIFSVIASLNIIDSLQFSPSTHNRVSRIKCFNLPS